MVDGAPFAVPALLRLRFPNAQRLVRPAIGWIDQVNALGRPVPDEVTTTTIPRGAPLYVRGWAVQPDAAGEPAAVFVTIDGTFAAEARTGISRPDVAALYGPAAASSGFEAMVPTHGVPPGEHSIAIAVVHDTKTFSVGPQRDVTIVASALNTTINTPLADAVRIELDAFEVGIDRVAADRKDVTVPLGSTVTALGWAIDQYAGRPCPGVYAIIDDELIVRGRSCGERPDVAASFENPALTFCAFEVRIDSALVGIGDHVLRIGALSSDGTTRGEGVPCRLRVY